MINDLNNELDAFQEKCKKLEKNVNNYDAPCTRKASQRKVKEDQSKEMDVDSSKTENEECHSISKQKFYSNQRRLFASDFQQDIFGGLEGNQISKINSQASYIEQAEAQAELSELSSPPFN